MWWLLVLLWRLLVHPLGSSLVHRRLPLLLHHATLVVVDHAVGAKRGVAGRLVHRRSLGAEAPHSFRPSGTNQPPVPPTSGLTAYHLPRAEALQPQVDLRAAAAAASHPTTKPIHAGTNQPGTAPRHDPGGWLQPTSRLQTPEQQRQVRREKSRKKTLPSPPRSTSLTGIPKDNAPAAGGSASWARGGGELADLGEEGGGQPGG